MMRLNSIEPTLRHKIRQDMDQYYAQMMNRTEIIQEFPSEGLTKSDSLSLNQEPKFIFGQNKAATEEAIILKYWLKEDLAIRDISTPIVSFEYLINPTNV